jgi:hypothetical protein
MRGMRGKDAGGEGEKRSKSKTFLVSRWRQISREKCLNRFLFRLIVNHDVVLRPEVLRRDIFLLVFSARSPQTPEQ